MSKRTWSQSNDVSNHPQTSLSPNARTRPSELVPSISRKVKACAACRKQKIKCLMDDSGPPCKRCSERNLSCVLNKSLQTLIEERSQWKDTISEDLGRVHSALQDVLSTLSLPALPPLQTASDNFIFSPHDDAREDQREEQGPSCDNSPRVSLKDDSLPHVPIESLYQITRLRSLRSDDPADEARATPTRPSTHPVDDFISRGLVGVEDAERLVNLYLNRIDHFIYMIGGTKYRNLEALRRGSPILTACICTVAALHDPLSNHLYGVCNREFRRLMAASMFDRRIDLDHMRAMCIGSYWLHDLSWTLSGYAIRRATEINLGKSFNRVITENSEEAMDCLRIWYLLYICDHHLSILYGRPSLIREDASIGRWEELIKSRVFTESDKRLVSQMALLIIMSNVRELFGRDTGDPVPRAFMPQLVNFSRQIDQWMGYWSTELLRKQQLQGLGSTEVYPYANPVVGQNDASVGKYCRICPGLLGLHQFIGEFPTRGAVLHCHLAKLHLHSHVFRGLKGDPVPSCFYDSAVAAVSAATSIIELLLTDRDIREGLVGIPHYIHSMIAFACVFLLKVAAQYSGQFIEDAVVLDVCTKAVQQFRSTAVGKWHLVHLMADGLEKMAAKKIKTLSTQSNLPLPNIMNQAELRYVNEPSATLPPLANGNEMYNFDDEFSLSTTPFLHFDSGNFDFSFSEFGL